jgi:NAD(P)-dependent dehydrogenase (short-subunit alcohol dehydrogenase family)
MKLENRVAIVTGAGSGIGRAIALRLARDGCHVVVNDINLELADKVVAEIKSLSCQAIAVRADVSKSQEVNRMVQTALGGFGRIHILVNNAGGSARQRRSMFHESTEEVWDYVLGINLKGVLNCSRAVINHMIENRSGKIVNIASVAGMVGSSAGMADYSAAKAGIIGFSMALAKEVGSYGINVNCVSPGPIETEPILALPEAVREQWKKSSYLGRLGKPEDVAAVVAFLVSDEAGFITGQNYAVCGARNLGT